MTNLCLVTGGAGFIGSHTVDLLVERGYQVRVLDSLQPRVHPTGAPSWLSPLAEFVRGDVTDATVMREVLEGVQSVIHLAAYQDYMPDFSRFIHTNTESAALIFEIAVSDPAKYPLEKVVFASSQAVCGEGRYVCTRCAGGVDAPGITEQLAQPGLAYGFPPGAVHTPAPRSMEQLRSGDWNVRCPQCGEAMSPLLIDELTVAPGTTYGISKYAIELLADRLGRRYQIPTACMRYTYVQGPRNSFHNPYSGIARRFVLRLLDGLPPTIYEDGAQLRDYVNVRDVARANVLVLDDERSNFKVFNVGGGRAVPVHTVAEILIAEFGSDLRADVSGDFRVGDTRHTVSDISALQALGWSPTISLEDSLAEYVAWVRQQGGVTGRIEETERIMRDQGVIQRAESVG
jgi:dTDP-L-rhamnose 4-epimerase